MTKAAMSAAEALPPDADESKKLSATIAADSVDRKRATIEGLA